MALSLWIREDISISREGEQGWRGGGGEVEGEGGWGLGEHSKQICWRRRKRNK